MTLQYQHILNNATNSKKEALIEELIENGLNEEERFSFIPIIISYLKKYNDWTLVLLIDLSNDEKLVSEELLETYLSTLLLSRSMYIKLSLLDYISNTLHLYQDKDFMIDFSPIAMLANDKKSRIILRNQALINLINIFPLKRIEYIGQLINNLKKTNDYRAHIRLYSSLMDDDRLKLFSSKDINQMLEITESMNLGKAVDAKVEDFKDFTDNLSSF